MAFATLIASGFALAFADAQTIIANDVIRAGDVVTTGMVSTEEGSAAFDSPVIGREVRRTIYAGQEVRFENTQAPRLVSRNQLVTIKYISGGLEITTTGRAMGEAALNESVSVLNLQSRKMVNGVVQKDGWVLAQ